MSFSQSGSRSAFLSFLLGNSPSFSSGSLYCPLHRSNDGTTRIFLPFSKVYTLPYSSPFRPECSGIALVVCRSYVLAVRDSPYILYHTLHIGQVAVCSKRIYNILHFSNSKNVFPQRCNARFSVQSFCGNTFYRQYRTKIVRQMRRQIFRQMKQKAE